MRLVIIAEHRLSAEGIRGALRHAPGCQVVGYIDGRRPCGLLLANAGAEVVLLDEPASQEAALARIREARGGAPQAQLILLTARMESEWLAEAATAGIDAAIARTPDLECVGVLVREVVAHNMFHAFGRPAAAPRRDAGEGLTSRELEILRLVSDGASNARVAATLWVTEQTVKFHLSNVYTKLGVANRTEASHYAHVNGLVDSSSYVDSLARLAA